MKTISNVIILSFLLTISHVFAQPPTGTGSEGKMEPIGTINGKVIDNRTRDPLPYSNIILNSQRDSTLITGTIAGEDGSFLLEKVPFGRFYVEVKFIGYEKKIITDIMITPEKNVLDLGVIRILEATEQLQEVQVTAERSPVEYRIDKKVIHVSENLNATGGSAAQALENVPSVTVDVDGNVSLRGSSNYTVLIDGKPSPLEGSDALRQIPASAVENIEIITNPSAKYDPDGLAGIINIITKKRALDGISGIVNASVGTGDKYRGDFLVNYKNDKLSFFLGADYTDETRRGEINVSQISIMNDTSNYITHFGDGPFTRNGYTFKGGIGYKFNDQNSISVDGSYGYGNFSRYENEKYKEYSIPSTTDVFYLQNGSDARFEDFYNFSFNYEKIFNNKDHKLTSYLYYSKEWGGSNENINQYLTDENWVINDSDPYRIFIDEPGKESELRFQTDYSKPIGGDGKLEAGYQLRTDKENESYYFNEWDNNLNEWVDNSDFSNSLAFNRNIQALYGIYSDQIWGFEYQLGLRGEYTYRSVNNIKSDQPSVLDRFDYFPTAHLSRKIGKQDQAQISYSRRIRRPRGGELDPFVSYMNPITMRMGNPNLLPEYVDSYELTFQKGLGKSFISLEGYYRLTHDAMTRVTKFQEDGTRLLTMENLNEEHAMGAELMLNFLVNKWFNFNISGNLYNFKLIGTISETDVATSSTNYDSRCNLNFRITPTTRLQVQGFYQGPSVTAQGSREDFLMTSAAIKQDFFKEKLSATLQIQDIFGTGSFNFTNEGPNFYDSINMKRESQVVRLTLGFRINNYKKQNVTRDEGSENGNGMDQEIGY
jgi:outer membrane receptor protein involved in Fe transport